MLGPVRFEIFLADEFLRQNDLAGAMQESKAGVDLRQMDRIVMA
jgi:hypothetical protein